MELDLLDDIKQLFELLRQSEFEIREFDIAAPSSEVPADVAEIPVPVFLRDLYKKHSGRICARYSRDLSKPERKRFGDSIDSNTLYGGPTLIAADGLANARQQLEEFVRDSWLGDSEEEAAIWFSAAPFVETICGDYLAFNSSGHVVYLCHDGDSFTLANSCEEFWSIWRSVYFVGPEYWMLNPFRGSDRLFDPSSANIATFKKAFQALLNAS
jgi:hypothetical protein